MERKRWADKISEMFWMPWLSETFKYIGMKHENNVMIILTICQTRPELSQNQSDADLVLVWFQPSPGIQSTFFHTLRFFSILSFQLHSAHTLQRITWKPGIHFNMTLPYQYRKSHCEISMVLELSYLIMGFPVLITGLKDLRAISLKGCHLTNTGISFVKIR